MNTPIESALSVIESDDPFAVARVRAMITVYSEVWNWDAYEVLDVEKEFIFPLLNPETESPSRTFDEAGKIDLLLRHRGTERLIVGEHKSTSDSVAPDSFYWDQLRMDQQISRYFLAAARDGQDVQGILYDVLRKPGQRPSGIPLLDADGTKIVHDRNGARVKTKDGKKWRETSDTEQGYVLQTRPETPDEFEARLLAVMRADPHAYFAQREVPRLDSDLLEYMNDSWSFSQQLLYFRKRNIWPKNTDACHAWGTCSMFDICSGRASVDGVRYRQRENVHPELTVTSDKELLTNTRLRAFKKCSRFHKLVYEDRVERVDEDPEALRVGQLLHLALEAYFNALKA